MVEKGFIVLAGADKFQKCVHAVLNVYKNFMYPLFKLRIRLIWFVAQLFFCFTTR